MTAPPMTPPPSLTALPPVVLVHLVAALCAVLIGAVALSARKGSPVHRGAGRLWVLLMAATAASALFIPSAGRLQLFGFGPIHLLILSTAYGLWRGVAEARRGRLAAHRRAMRITYVGACLVAGAFTLLPGRFLGDWVRTALSQPVSSTVLAAAASPMAGPGTEPAAGPAAREARTDGAWASSRP